MAKKFLLATDGSEYALKAGQYADWLASNVDGAELMVVYVGHVLPEVATYVAMDVSAFIQEVGREVMEKTKSVLSGGSYPITTRILEGNPATEICELAEAECCDLIIMGSRGLGALGRLFLGSVSDQVAHHAHCAVLIVK